MMAALLGDISDRCDSDGLLCCVVGDPGDRFVFIDDPCNCVACHVFVPLGVIGTENVGCCCLPVQAQSEESWWRGKLWNL